MVSSVLCQNTAADCGGLKAAHDVTVPVGTANEAKTDPRSGRCGPNRILACQTPPMLACLEMPVPIATEQREIKPGIDQRPDQRKPVGIATADEEHVARHAG